MRARRIPRAENYPYRDLIEKPMYQMATVNVEVSISLKIALDKEVARVGGNESDRITATLAIYLDTPVHTLFQVSTSGALVAGLWSPGFSSAFSIVRFHFHFVSEDRQHGGHLLGCAADRLQPRMKTLSEFHLALPETESFLKADLSKSSAAELAYPEHAH
jgi:alpha-acetolactate decarboxylase